MSEVLTTFFQFVASYVGIIVLFFLILNFLTKGFLGTYLAVKMSKGKKNLAIIHSATDIYYKAGTWKESFFVFKDRSKDKKRIPIGDVEFKKFVKYTLGVASIEIDEVGNKIVDPDFNVVQMVNVDPARLNSLILRIKNMPKETSGAEVIKWILWILTFLGVVLIFIKLGEIQQIVQNLGRISGNI